MYIGLDLGTSGLRALMIDQGGAIIASADSDYGTSHPHHGWSEQDPQLWIDACGDIFDALREAHPKDIAQLKGIGVAGHMHGATLLAKKKEVLRPCILWNDTRSYVEAAQMDGAESVRNLSGNVVFPGFTAPKLMWVQNNEPEVFAKIAHVLLPKDYLRLWLTGVLKAEVSDAAGTSWLDVGAREWSETLLNAGGMTKDQMPSLVEGSEPAGNLRKELRDQLGISHEVVVVGGGADNAAAACGVGAMGEGQGFVSLGTSGVILGARDTYSPQADSAVHTFCHAVPNTWYQMGVTLAATDSLGWLSKIVGRSPADLTAELGDKLMEPTSINFLPYLSGERTPHNDSMIRGAFLGLDIGHSRSDMTQAVMQGVSFALRQSLDALRSTGANLPKLLAIGGGANSKLWVQMLATTFNIPIVLPEKGDFGAALGAARLAICGSTGAAPKDIMLPPEVAATIEPNNELVPAYEAAYQKFQQIYPAVRAVQ